MRILLVHNCYGSSAPSGENKVFEAEKLMLERHGHDVRTYVRNSDEIRNGNALQRCYGKIKGALCTVANPFAARKLGKMCRDWKPDIVHFHNVFPLISPLTIWIASKHAPVVLTLHNYRTVCAAGVPTRDGKVCSLCFDKRSAWDGVTHRCYRGIIFATLPLAINIALYRSLLPKWVFRFIVLSEFQKRKMVEYGWPEETIAVKGNFVSGGVERGGVEIKKDQIVYVGRLSKEKGVETLIEAFRQLDIKGLKLVVVGDGVDRQELARLAMRLNVEFVGQKPAAKTRSIVAESKALVSPSSCWETFGLAAAEAMSVGTPSIVSNVGALPDIVQDGRFGEIFEAGNAEACAAAIKRLLSRPDYDEICAAAKREAATKYSEDANYKRLMEIYGEVVGG